MSPTAAPARRTQAERRSATRRALLRATVASLVEQGYAHTTTTSVCRGAGVSQGALFKHFATKDDLLAAVGEHLYDDLTASWVSRFDALPRPGGTDRQVADAVALLWELYQAPEHGAAHELLVAARTDPGLRAALAPVVDRHARRLRVVAAERFPALADDPVAAVTLDLVLEAMLGMALSRGVDHSTEHVDLLLAHLTTVAGRAFDDRTRSS